MKRRNFVAGVLLAVTIPHAQAQQRSKVYRLAIASPTTPITEMNEASGHPVHQPLHEELKRLGYVEGRNGVRSWRKPTPHNQLATYPHTIGRGNSKDYCRDSA